MLPSRTWAHRCKRSSTANVSADDAKVVDGEGDEENASVCDGGDSIILQVKMEIPELIVRDTPLEH